ncbi:MAG: TIGR03960 family B12-binding radical SAM protein [Treponema sp.]|uniref:TIGR03960 family B12-binding radical SAM protein n=1 Tax=Treponema sp. TaxID=166 RepID=UPI0025CBACFA|nr:TIGR03960 family B12-binding radical SAM protein [Treponema sp.]MBQ9281067.1 TIGR03960 family B12-binding radical SAM protein [Treponema sp.]
MNLINPLSVFGNDLCSVQNPSAYIGGEFGSIVKEHSDSDSLFNFCMAFPDVYTIGMANQAIKIIYNGLNKKKNIRCERVFAVESDFENLLKKYSTPLYTLETGMPLNEVDIIGFSIGYELGITGVLSILELGRIPLLKKERDENDPIVLAGGCGATNPAPFSDFFDAVFIGEAEGGMFELIEELAELKKSGAGRAELLQRLSEHPAVWTEDMSEEKCGHSVARRAIWSDFGKVPSVESFMPIPNVKPVQDHGVVEIMRGCPNGCRFCHAGVYYRPQRAKTKQLIFDDVDMLVNEAGYREISLTSLSSADYPNIEDLLDDLNARYKSQNVSFQLPSLKVNSFSLPLLEKLSEVRKSGLTFAVETPEEAWQLRLNKEVYAQHLVDVILDAKKRGWNKAKFYFMVGLPFPETEEITEEKAIVDFLIDLQNRTRIQCNVNVGTFIPKPHTAYQWVRQISPEESERKLSYIREHLPRGRFHVGTHDINTSYLEGLLSRGDKRAGKVILSAFRKGARLDAWENHLKENLKHWESAFKEADFDVKESILRERSKDEILPWDDVSLGVAKNFYKKEWDKNQREELTPKCSPNCDHRCGVCNNKTCVNIDNKPQDVQKIVQSSDNSVYPEWNIPVMYRVIFQFTKKNGGEYISHLSQIEFFNRAVLKSSLPVIYTTGFNPLPRLEFASTLSLGISSDAEIASTVLYENIPESDFISSLNRHLPSSIQIQKAFIFPVTNQRRRESLSTGLWGNVYEYSFKCQAGEVKAFFDSVLAQPFLDRSSLCEFSFDGLDGRKVTAKLLFQKDRPFRNALEEFFGKKIWEIVSIHKIQTLAKPDITGWTSEINAAYQSSLENMKKHSEMLEINARFKEKILSPEENMSSAKANAISYFELYRRIAVVNAELIAQRDRLMEKKAEKRT